MRRPADTTIELLGRYLRPQARSVALLAALLGGTISLQLAFPQILRRFVDAAQAGAGLSTLAGMAALYLGVAVAAQLVATTEAYVAANVGQVATNAMRADLALHCLRLDTTFHNARTPGELIERIDGDVGALGTVFSRFVVDVLGNTLLLLGVLALLWRLDWRIGLAFSLLSLGWLGGAQALQGIRVRFSRASRQASAELYGFLEERLAGTEDLRASGAEAYTMRRFYERARTLLWAELRARVASNTVGIVAALVISLGMALAILGGGILFRRGELSLGSVFLLLSYAQQLRQPLQQLNRQAQEMAAAAASIGRIQELFAQRSALQDAPVPVPLPAGPLAVAFDGVSFGYQAERTDGADGVDDLALDGVSFQLEPGRVLGLLGRTGSGKTTIGRLLFRLYDPTDGAVRLGGVDLRQASLEEVRARVGVVTQEVQLFHASVRDNLTFFDRGDPSSGRVIPDQRLLEALRLLELWPWFASLPDGLDTWLAPNGGGLSAGEAQLLAFVRVFLKDPGLVILDEASARLDPATERRIERAVDRLLGQDLDGRPRTAVVIAHRLATVRRADEVLLLGNGRVLEHGPRAALAADPGTQLSALLRSGLAEALA